MPVGRPQSWASGIQTASWPEDVRMFGEKFKFLDRYFRSSYRQQGHPNDGSFRSKDRCIAGLVRKPSSMGYRSLSV